MSMRFRLFAVLLVLYVATEFSVAACPQASRVRSVNFNEFSYRVGPCCEEIGATVKVHQGKFANEKATFEVSQVLYGSFTGSEEEQAVVVTSCSPKVTAHPGFEYNLVYVYGVRGSQPELLAVFTYGEPGNLTGAATEAISDKTSSCSLTLLECLCVRVLSHLNGWQVRRTAVRHFL